MRVRSFSCALLLGIAFWGSSPRSTAQSMPDPPSTDSLIAGIRARLALCDTQWTDMTYIATTHERRLDSDGTIKEEKTFRTRVYARSDQEREVLEAMWKNGEPVSEKTLRKEGEKREEERRGRAGNKEDRKEKRGARRDVGILEPFAAENSDRYLFSDIVGDTIHGVATWRITVAPQEDSEDLVRGTAWVRTDTYDAVAEEYEPAKLPNKMQALAFELEYEPVGIGCAMPQYFHIAGHGKVLIFIKFNFEAEVIIDSVEINPGLPDSLFEIVNR